jgi:hypothetical protein
MKYDDPEIPKRLINTQIEYKPTFYTCQTELKNFYCKCKKIRKREFPQKYKKNKK